MEFPLLVICDPVHFQEEADSDSSPTTLFAAGSRALLLCSPPSLVCSFHTLSDAMCFHPQIILVTLLWALPIFSVPLSHGFMKQCPLQCLPVSFIIVHDTACSNLPPINDLNSSLHLLSPTTFPAMCC